MELIMAAEDTVAWGGGCVGSWRIRLTPGGHGDTDGLHTAALQIELCTAWDFDAIAVLKQEMQILRNNDYI
ncbi:hypothetical protein AAFF_G00226710 [Aldrovandia affinis]|uniref:Uncharacterized protein n=1 Tax=Aldrovandia affinis TaxID=143900 RepID=A0AAD7TCK8_9TELE|nr:hypothetical protein AAFF_G00226710 [Aldrovandia affinis]